MQEKKKGGKNGPCVVSESRAVNRVLVVFSCSVVFSFSAFAFFFNFLRATSECPFYSVRGCRVPFLSLARLLVLFHVSFFVRRFTRVSFFVYPFSRVSLFVYPFSCILLRVCPFSRVSFFVHPFTRVFFFLYPVSRVSFFASVLFRSASFRSIW